jgi:hypothetical protein
VACGWTYAMSHLSLPFRLVRALTASAPTPERPHPIQVAKCLQTHKG